MNVKRARGLWSPSCLRWHDDRCAYGGLRQNRSCPIWRRLQPDSEFRLLGILSVYKMAEFENFFSVAMRNGSHDARP